MQERRPDTGRAPAAVLPLVQIVFLADAFFVVLIAPMQLFDAVHEPSAIPFLDGVDDEGVLLHGGQIPLAHEIFTWKIPQAVLDGREDALGENAGRDFEKNAMEKGAEPYIRYPRPPRRTQGRRAASALVPRRRTGPLPIGGRTSALPRQASPPAGALRKRASSVCPLASAPLLRAYVQHGLPATASHAVRTSRSRLARGALPENRFFCRAVVPTPTAATNGLRQVRGSLLPFSLCKSLPVFRKCRPVFGKKTEARQRAGVSSRMFSPSQRRFFRPHRERFLLLPFRFPPAPARAYFKPYGRERWTSAAFSA